MTVQFSTALAPEPVQIEADARTGAGFRDDVIAGMSQPQKTLSSRWLYDDRGSTLFEDITGLPEYYPSRTETAILKQDGGQMAEFAGPQAGLLEYGAGAGVKTQILLEAFDRPGFYLPIDIASDFLKASAARINQEFPQVQVIPVAADFSRSFDLPADLPACNARTAFFPGSTIGNLNAEAAGQLLSEMTRHTNEGDTRREGRALIGIDLIKGLDGLLPAYDDAAGVTAAFNRNLLVRINRELGATFDIESFRHEARWNETEAAVEMHLVSTKEQQAGIAGQTFSFEEGETIHTESSRKYSVESFSALAAGSGWRVEQVWSDPEDLFAIVGLVAGRE